jgi:hypothetical protein
MFFPCFDFSNIYREYRQGAFAFLMDATFTFFNYVFVGFTYLMIAFCSGAEFAFET